MAADDYSAEFAAALGCYNAMATTKKRHFDYLQRLESRKKKFNVDPTESENHKLTVLLTNHSEEVQAFKKACEQLKHQNEFAHTALFEYIAGLNNAPDNG
ncbi:hypothetical protein AB833_25015 [Chromatiales bacterium (ex Bugula neritina AB1)]|nr:hypothetical protein AB833_25015 [Chromatiales bacterium (ex Bugula neritina AB1)]